MKPDKVELVSKETVFKAYFQIDKYRLKYALYGGGTSQALEREVFERGQVAAVLPVDVARERVVLIEQFRVGAYAVGWQPWLLECVAGIIEEGERNEEVVRREAIEESGCEITALIPIARYLSSPGACTETVDLYCGRVDAQGAGGIHGLTSEGEDIKVQTYSVEQALALLESGGIVNAKTIIALQWLALNYDQLKSRWATPSR